MTPDEQDKELIRNMAERVRRNGGKAVSGLTFSLDLIAKVRKWTSDTDTAADCWAIRNAYPNEFKKDAA